MWEKKERLWTAKYVMVLLNMLCNGMAGMFIMAAGGFFTWLQWQNNKKQLSSMSEKQY